MVDRYIHPKVHEIIVFVWSQLDGGKVLYLLPSWIKCPYCLPPLLGGQAQHLIQEQRNAVKKEKLLLRQMSVITSLFWTL